MQRRWRTALLAVGLAFLVVVCNGWLLTTEAGAVILTRLLEWQSWPVDEDRVREKAQAIAVLGGRTRRIDYGAQLHLATGVPLLLVGKGTGDSGFAAESEKMEDILLRRYGLGPRWVETESLTTRENALFARCLVASMGVQTIALVTDRHHMPRARRLFEMAGFDVIAAPTPDTRPVTGPLSWASLVPGHAGMKAVRRPLGEWAGLLLAPLEAWVRPSPPCPYGGPVHDAA